MKAKIFSLFILFIFTGCESYLNVSTNNYYFTNEFNKKFYVKVIQHVLSCPTDSFEIVINGKCSDSLLASLFCNANSSIKYPDLIFDEIFLYNISDTTCMIDNYPSGQITKSKFEGFFNYKKNDLIRDKHHHRNNQITDYYLTINKDLLMLMSKDYTMLKKFPEYYKKRFHTF